MNIQDWGGCAIGVLVLIALVLIVISTIRDTMNQTKRDEPNEAHIWLSANDMYSTPEKKEGKSTWVSYDSKLPEEE